jgi:hypothetical protein
MDRPAAALFLPMSLDGRSSAGKPEMGRDFPQTEGLREDTDLKDFCLHASSGEGLRAVRKPEEGFQGGFKLQIVC